MVSDVMAPAVKRIRAYFGPVNRTTHTATLFDAAQSGAFALDAPPSPWVDLGWIRNFTRTSGTLISAVRTGSPASTQLQARTDVEASVTFAFESWGKLQLSLSAGTQQMNLLAVQSGAVAAGSGGLGVPATPLLTGSTASALNVGSTTAANFAAGSLVAVDVDYSPGTTGFVGSGVSGAYVQTSLTDVDYVRRVTLNVARIASVADGVLTLERPLLAGTPVTGMKVSPVLGFCDREGSSFFQEWSGLFVAEGQQGERIFWHYPRLQAAKGISETLIKSDGGFEAVCLTGSFRGLPVSDGVDGEKVICFRSYVTS